MIHRAFETSFAAWLTASRTGTALAGIDVRSGIPSDELGFPAVLVVASGADLVEGGVRGASMVNLDVSVASAAVEGGTWRTTHKNRTAALAKLLDDTNTNAALTAIQANQTTFTLFGWSLVELAAETEANIQMDTIRVRACAGDRLGSAASGTVNGDPQDFSFRHEIESIVTTYLAAELPEAVLDDYTPVPAYNDAALSPRRIVVSCPSADRAIPQTPRWRARLVVDIHSPAEYGSAHPAIAASIEEAMRSMPAGDFSSASVAVDGLLETGHSVDLRESRATDTLTLTLDCRVI